jgi:transporter family-2 protein
MSHPSAQVPGSRLGVIAGLTALVVGALTALQSRINGELADITESGLQAALVSFGSGWILLSIALLAAPGVRRGLADVVAALRNGVLRWWQVLGGLLGGFFVAVQSATVPLLGVAVFTVAVVAGQVSNSIVVDRIGLGPAGRQGITPTRVIAAVLALAAVVVAVSDRFDGAVEGSLLAVFAALVAGLAIAVQQAINGRVGATARNPWTAAWVNFTLGTAMLGTALGIAWGLTEFDPGAMPRGPWWVYLGGTIGVLFIAAAAWVVQRLGVLLFALLTISGQLIGALLLDWLAPAAGVYVHLTLVIGVLLAGVAVAVGSASSWGPRRAPRRPH